MGRYHKKIDNFVRHGTLVRYGGKRSSCFLVHLLGLLLKKKFISKECVNYISDCRFVPTAQKAVATNLRVFISSIQPILSIQKKRTMPLLLLKEFSANKRGQQLLFDALVQQYPKTQSRFIKVHSCALLFDETPGSSTPSIRRILSSLSATNSYFARWLLFSNNVGRSLASNLNSQR